METPPQESIPAAALDIWAIVDQMGHNRLAGKVTAELVAGAQMLRVEIPEGPAQGTRYVHPQSLFGMVPVSEEVARAVARSVRPPVEAWELRALMEEGERARQLPEPEDDSFFPDEPEETLGDEIARERAEETPSHLPERSVEPTE